MQSSQQTKRRKKRMLQVQVTKTVEVVREQQCGYGFTISGENPCFLSCIVPGSAAQIAGLKAGDLLHVVNGQNVSRACHDDVVRMVGLSKHSLQLQVAENSNSSDSSSDDDYLPGRKSGCPNRVRIHHCLEEKASKQQRISSFSLSAKEDLSESLQHDNTCDIKSDLSSSLTSQEDQGWVKTADVRLHQLEKTRFNKNQYQIGGILKPQNDLCHYKLCSQTVTSKAKKISSVAAVVKRLPPVIASVKHIQQGQRSRQHMFEGIQANILPTSRDAEAGIQANILPTSRGAEAGIQANILPTSRGAEAGIQANILPTSRGAEAGIQANISPTSRGAEAFIQEDNDNSKKRNSKLPEVTENMNAVVGYIGSIEIPTSHTHPYQKLHALGNAVKRLRQEKRVHTLVLMEVRPSGVQLINAMGKQLALYPSHRIAFSGICPDDERFFGVVTQSTPDQGCSNYLGEGAYLRVPNYTCHIFMIEPDISAHIAHMQHAHTFQIECISNPGTGECDQFPRSAASLIVCIANLYRDKPPSSKFDSDFVQSRTFAHPTSQSEPVPNTSNSRLMLGKNEISWKQQNQQVCVVDVGSGRSMLYTGIVSDDVVENANWHNHSVKNAEASNEEIISSYLMNGLTNNQEECWQQDSQRASNKLTLQAVSDTSSLEVSRTESIELNMTIRSTDTPKQKMHNFLQVEQQPHSEDKSPLTSDRDCYIGEHILSLSASQDGHTVLETNRQWQSQEFAFVKPSNPPTCCSSSSIQHATVRSAFHLLRSASATPLEEKDNKPETVDLDHAIGKLSPHVLTHNSQSSSAFFHPPSSPFFPHRDSDDEEDELDVYEDDPYIRQILDQFNQENMTLINDDNRRFSHGFTVFNKKFHREQVCVPSVQKWTKRIDGALHKQSFSQSLETLSADGNTNTSAHKLMTAACSVNNIGSYTHDYDSKAGRVASWAVHFDQLLKDQLGIVVFTTFLKQEFSDENIQFWKVCQQFRLLIHDHHQRKLHAQEIYQRYLSAEASDPINVDTTARTYAERFLDSPEVIMFDVAQHQIFQLMKQDSYPRFLKSELYKSMLLKDLEDNTQAGRCQQGEQVSENISTGKKQKNAGKENSDKRRRSILPWKQHKMDKVRPECELKRESKKGKRETNNLISSSSNMLTGNISSQPTTTTTISSNSNMLNGNISSQPTTTTTISSSSRLGIDLSTMRKEVFHQNETYGCQESQVKFCRIVMPDGSTTVVCAKSGQTVQTVLAKLCEKRSIKISSFDVFLLGSDQPVNLNDDMSTLGSKEIVMEKRIIFQLNLPDGKSVETKAKPNRTIGHVLKPILDKYAFSMDSIVLHLATSCELINLEMPVSMLDKQRVVIISDPDTATVAGSHTDMMASLKRRVPLFGLFRASEKRVAGNKRQQQWHHDLHFSKT